jgi:hypothetical protein
MLKPYMTAEEIDAFLADPQGDEGIKGLLLLDVQPQGYQPQSIDWVIVLRDEQPDGTVREAKFTIRALAVGLRERINEDAPGLWRERFGEDPPANMTVNFPPRA